jgi:hypothetical protein
MFSLNCTCHLSTLESGFAAYEAYAYPAEHCILIEALCDTIFNPPNDHYGINSGSPRQRTIDLSLLEQLPDF